MHLKLEDSLEDIYYLQGHPARSREGETAGRRMQTVLGVPNLFSPLFLLRPRFSSRRESKESFSPAEHRVAQSPVTRASRLAEGAQWRQRHDVCLGITRGQRHRRWSLLVSSLRGQGWPSHTSAQKSGQLEQQGSDQVSTAAQE